MSTRRGFLLSSFVLAGTVTASARLSGFAAAASAATTADQVTSNAAFPQGVASGDPTQDKVVLWTRIEPVTSGETVPAVLQVSRNQDFGHLIAEIDVLAQPCCDHTVRVVLKDLAADTRYFYRFLRQSDGLSSPIGRTRTAPEPTATRALRFAVASCQNFQTGYYHAYRHLVEKEEKGGADDRLDFVLHLGDFIYELIFSAGVRPLEIPDKQWDLTDGIFGEPVKLQYATTLNDYRSLYKSYLSDPWLRAARQRWPFICTWDDHEFANDCWQSNATYPLPRTPSQKRKVSANQAWFEFVPALLSDLEDGQPARDFEPTAVENESFSEFGLRNKEPEPENLKAINSLNIIRKFNWGRCADIIVPDSRSYRSAHPVPEDVATRLSFHPRAFLPKSVVEEFDAGRTAHGGSPREAITFKGRAFENTRRDDPAGTMWGAEQRDWVKASLTNSQAVWKFCANSVPMLPLSFDFRFENKEFLPEESVLTDSWDGFSCERADFLAHLKNTQIRNVVSLAGDHHMHMAGTLHSKGDSVNAAAMEFSVAGISSTSFGSTMRSFASTQLAESPNHNVLSGDAISSEKDALPWLNVTLLYGWKEAMRCLKERKKKMDPILSTEARRLEHIAFIDSGACGVAVVIVDEHDLQVDFVTFSEASIRSDYTHKVAPAYIARLATSATRPDVSDRWLNPKFDGPSPIPFRWKGR